MYGNNELDIEDRKDVVLHVALVGKCGVMNTVGL
jgi:hypothetical protein